MKIQNTRLDAHTESDAPAPLCQTIDQSCPSCGSSMSEVDRRQENGTMYVWLECVESSCAYQWLDHFSCW
jgi:hypothetical protein